MTVSRDRLCGQPVSWGINYVPDWGEQLPAERVLGDMAALGLTATEYQPGLFPEDAEAARALLAQYGLRAVAGWTPLVLYTDDLEAQLQRLRELAPFLHALGAEVVTLGAVHESAGFDVARRLDEGDWRRLLVGLDAVAEEGQALGLRVVLHPHVGTAVETRDDIERVYRGSRVQFCLDVGHI